MHRLVKTTKTNVRWIELIRTRILNYLQIAYDDGQNYKLLFMPV